MPEKTPDTVQQQNFGTPTIPFQLSNLSIKEKSDPKWGKAIAEDLMAKINGGMSSYFWVRNQRFKTNRNYAAGKVNMSRFQDLLEFNGKVNYINLNWNCIQIVNTIISGEVGRWMSQNEKVTVTATDSLSQKQKEDEYAQIEFIIDNKQKLQQLQDASGVQMIPQNDSIPADKEELLLWKSQFQRLPEEIEYEMGINDVLSSNGWFDALKEKMLWDSACTGLVGTYTWMDAEGVIHVEWLKPENCFYSYTNYDDFRDTTWRGYMRTRTISELRKMYGKEFHPENPNALTEEQLFKIAQTCKEYQLYDNITWITEWNVTFLRPYDEWNAYVLEFEWKTVDTESYTIVTTKENKSTIIKKGKPNKKKDNETIIDDSRINIYRGAYLRDNQIMLEWGLKKNMIRPQDPKELGNAEFSYSFYMVQNYDMTCLGIPEKIQEPVDQMIVARLKMQQLVAKMRPVGAAVNWDALQNIDYGLGEGNKAIDVKKLYDQTGDLYWRNKDAEGNPIPVPIQELQNSGFLNQLQGLIMLYDKHYQILKDELGEDPNLLSQAVQPRVAAQNVQASQQLQEFATGQYYRAYVRCMEDTAKKVSCLMKDSVEAGAEVYRHIVKADNVQNRIFNTKIKLLPTEVEVQQFDAMLQNAIMSTPELAIFLNQFQAIQMAKEDVKLAWTYYNQCMKKMLLWQQQTAQQNQQQTIQGQIQSAQAAEQAKQQTMQMEMQLKNNNYQAESKGRKEEIMLQGFFGIYQKGITVPPELKAVEQEMIKNVAIPVFAENIKNQMDLQDGLNQMQQDQQEDEQQNQQPDISQPQNTQQPQPVAA